MNWLKQNWIRLGIFILMIVALGNHPYAYYQFLRWATAISSFYLAYLAYENKRNTWVWIFVIIGILFNPIQPFYMDKGTWAIYNLLVAVIYFISIFNLKFTHERKS